MSVLEKEIEQKLRKMIERHGGLCLKWVCPGWLGVPDRICLLPGARVVFVETKRPTGGSRSSMQKWWARKLQALGFLHLWVHTEADIKALEASIPMLGVLESCLPKLRVQEEEGRNEG